MPLELLHFNTKVPEQATFSLAFRTSFHNPSNSPVTRSDHHKNTKMTDALILLAFYSLYILIFLI